MPESFNQWDKLTESSGAFKSIRIFWYNLGMHYLIKISSVILLLTTTLHAIEELVVVQGVSKSKKTFIIRKGKTKGLAHGQESLFSNKSFSISAKVVEMSNQHSLWKVSDERATIPFEKGDILSFTNSIENFYTEIPMLKYNPNELSEKAYVRDEKTGKKVSPHKWSLKLGGSYTFNETASSQASTVTTTRGGTQLGAYYIMPFSYSFDLNLGLRLDGESVIYKTDNVKGSTNRYMLMAIGTYHFLPFAGKNDHIYASFGVGWGLSNTTIGSESSSGNARILPTMLLGYQKSIKDNKYAAFVEGGFESIVSSESYSGATAEQTSLLNSKLTIGFKF